MVSGVKMCGLGRARRLMTCVLCRITYHGIRCKDVWIRQSQKTDDLCAVQKTYHGIRCKDVWIRQSQKTDDLCAVQNYLSWYQV